MNGIPYIARSNDARIKELFFAGKVIDLPFSLRSFSMAS